jgi:hypothetical protein
MQARSLLVLALGATSLFVSRTTLAQPETDKTKSDAQALLASGLRLFPAKDYLGALAG